MRVDPADQKSDHSPLQIKCSDSFFAGLNHRYHANAWFRLTINWYYNNIKAKIRTFETFQTEGNMQYGNPRSRSKPNEM